MLYRTPRFAEKYDRFEHRWHLDRNEHHDHSSEFQRLQKRFARTLTNFTEYPNLTNGYKALQYIFGASGMDIGKINDDDATFLLSNGSDEALKSVFWFFRDKKTVSIVSPTYQAATLYTQMYDYTINNFPYIQDGKSFTFDFDKFVSSSNVLYIASPDNITGTKITSTQVEQLVQEAANGKIVIFDLAYEMKYPHHLHRKKNVIIVGTLSKFFAGAFLRVGYISAPSDIMRDMYQYKTSYEITGPGIKYLDFVAHNIPAFGRSKIRVDNGKNFIECILNHSMKTYGNFALFPHEDRLLEILKAAVVKECEIDGKKFIRVTATDPVTFRKILNGNPPPI